MRNLIFLLFFIPSVVLSQAHLGVSEREVRDDHPDNVFKTGYTKSGEKYISTDFEYGSFVYYFNDTTHVTDLCIQIPRDMVSVNTLVQIYNTKYVVNSKTSWSAYLEGGSVMSIALVYQEDDKTYVFYYTSGR